jgi:hypothetical protein
MRKRLPAHDHPWRFCAGRAQNTPSGEASVGIELNEKESSAMNWTIVIVVLVTLLVLASLVLYKQRFFTLLLVVGAHRRKEQAKRTKAKTEPPLRTLTTGQVNELIRLSFERVERYLKEPRVDGLPEMLLRVGEVIDEEIAAETERRAGENLAICCFTKKHPLRDYQLLSDALIAETWFFANWWKMQPDQDDFDLRFIEVLGAKIKKLGYQLAN